MFPQLGAPVGFIAANGAVPAARPRARRPSSFRRWGWRLPFLASALLVGVGLWVRLRLTETPAFAAAARRGAAAARAARRARARARRATLIAGTFAVVACFAIFYLSTAFALGYGTTHARLRARDLPRRAARRDPVHGARHRRRRAIASDRFDPRRVLMAGCMLTDRRGPPARADDGQRLAAARSSRSCRSRCS